MMTLKAPLVKAVKALAAMAVLCTATAFAQTAKVHGTVTDSVGVPVKKGDVKFSTDKSVPEKEMKFAYIFPLDANGAYSATDIKPGDYVIFIKQGDVTADYQNVTIKAGDDKTVNFDMTREEYMKALTPERRKEIEDYKKKNAATSDANKVVANLNATLSRVRGDLAAASKTKDDVSKDVTDMQSATQAKPEEGVLWLTYGDVLQAQADHLIKADKAAGKLSTSDPDVNKALDDSVSAYKKSVELNAASKKPDAHAQGAGYNQIGNAYAKVGKTSESSAAFENAVKLEPASAGMFYNNEAAVLFNAQQIDGALAAAEKAIAADPNRADPYYIKGQALVQHATIDPKTQKPVAPAGCLEAYQKFLELAPDSPRAEEVRGLLQSFGQTVNTKYKAGKK